MLCHDYCLDVSSSHYLDTIKFELINEVNLIRRRAYLLPRDAMLHQIPISKYGELTYAAYNEENYQAREESESQFWNQDKR